jgi:5-formyltetrahydrofolate cyclo-ligase
MDALEKQRQRDVLKARLRVLSGEDRVRESAALVGRILQLPEWQKAGTVALFVPTGREPEIRPLFEAAWSEDKKVTVPRVNPDGATMTLHAVAGWSALAPGLWGVEEPLPDTPHCAIEEVGFALIPGLGFDLSCHRLGRGKGHYDRLLGAPGWRARNVGIFFDCQEIGVVPREAWDRGLDGVVTGTRLVLPALA